MEIESSKLSNRNLADSLFKSNQQFYFATSTLFTQSLTDRLLHVGSLSGIEIKILLQSDLYFYFYKNSLKQLGAFRKSFVIPEIRKKSTSMILVSSTSVWIPI